MKLKDYIERLFHGELFSLSMAEKGIDNISERNLKRLLSGFNSVLTDLHVRFNLKQDSVIIETYEQFNFYELDPKYSVLEPGEGVKYPFIIDTPRYRFKGNIAKIIGVYNEEGMLLPLNDDEKWASVFTPKSNVVQINHPYPGQAFEILFQATHPTLKFSEKLEEVLEQSIEIPDPLKNSLLSGVAAYVYSGMSGQTSTNKSQELQVGYENDIMRVAHENLLGDSVPKTSVKLNNRGFL